MRLLLGMPDPDSLGGPAACEPPFAAELRKSGHEVVEETYVYGQSAKPLSAVDRVQRVTRTAKRIAASVAAHRPDVIHLNTSFDKMALLRDAFVLHRLRRGTAKIFLKFHGSDLDLFKVRPAKFRPLISSVLSRADGIGLLSGEEREAFADAGVGPAKLFVVKNAVEPFDIGSEADERLRSRLGVASDTPVLLFIARFIPAKGLLDVIDAVAILRHAGRDVHLVCVGDGEQRAAAEARVAASQLTDRVHFTGYIPETEAAEFYAGSTLLVFPTYHFEGFPMVIFKSLSAGLPIVTTRIRAAADHLNEPENCLWTPPSDAGAISDRILRLLEDADLARQMSKNNKQLSRRFTADAITPEYLEIYASLTTG